MTTQPRGGPISVRSWKERVRRRVHTHRRLADLIDVDWLNSQVESLHAGTAQTRAHPLLQIFVVPAKVGLDEVQTRLEELSHCSGFSERMASIRRRPAGPPAWDLWNEIRTASWVFRSGYDVTFPEDHGRDSNYSPDLVGTRPGTEIAFEVATVGESPARVAERNKYDHQVRTLAGKARKAGQPSVYGGYVPLPPRFTRRARERDVESIDKAIRFLRGIKSGSKQAASYPLRVLHINLPSTHFSDADFLPDLYSYDDGLLYRSTGRVFAAYYGSQGQLLYRHHLIADGDALRPVNVEQLKESGRFVENTSWSAAIITLYDSWKMARNPFQSGRTVLYVPLRGANQDATLPGGIVNDLERGFPFDRTLSVGLDERRIYPEPSPAPLA